MSETNDKKLNRREIVKYAALVGSGFLGAVVFQNCSNVRFAPAGNLDLGSNGAAGGVDDIVNGGAMGGGGNPNTMPGEPGSVTNPGVCFSGSCISKAHDYPYINQTHTDLNGEPIATQANPGVYASVKADYQLNINNYSLMHYDQDTKTATNQKYLLTIDGSHPMNGASFGASNMVTDIFVFEVGKCALLYWTRLGTSDKKLSTTIILDQVLVNQGANLNVVLRSTKHGVWSQSYKLSAATAMPYSGAVAAWQSGVPFGGSSLERPYNPQDANGGQVGLNVALHTPTIKVISNDEVQACLGPLGAAHDRLAESHYVTGAALFDQNGNILDDVKCLNYARANADHSFTFKNLNLSGKGVKTLRVIVFDTFNGMMVGFKNYV